MTPHLTFEERARLGLLDTEIGNTEPIEIAVPPSDRGLDLGLKAFAGAGIVAGFSAARGLANLFEGRDSMREFAAVSSRTARAANVALHVHGQNHGVVLVEARAGRIHGRHAVDPAAMVHPDGDPTAIMADLNPGPATFELENGERLLLQFRERRCFLSRVPPEAPARVPDTIDPPLHELQHDLRDSWARRLLASAVAAPDRWTRVTAAGTFLRLWEPDRAEDVAAAVRRAVRGEAEPHTEVLRTWIDTLTSASLQGLRRACLARDSALHRDLEDLEIDLAPEVPAWIARFERLCRERDDLESARAVLAMADAASEVDAASEGLDARGRAFMASVPLVLEIDDERLRRAARTDPDAWWAMPALA